ncbi:RMD1 family protein [Novosphingobium sp. KCTC 2891]|uniref:RMD1 family protein n=1 Tax=Novosphingobium sp. KCTC 2891 TaxID=2989730 RepID=UPI002221D461|nr:RMD1 family protein [Novosphingobium sp. KCTC 2891]MCW1382359.1 RMD1 family protein [Novosphingobium sp. KCTC 2891]
MIVSPDVVMVGSLADTAPSRAEPLVATAWLLGARVRTKDIGESAELAQAGSRIGPAFVFRFGVVVTFAPRGQSAEALVNACAAHVEAPTDERETESVELFVSAEQADRIGAEGSIMLADVDPDRLLLVATVLARSAVLNRDEAMVASAFDASAPVVEDLRVNGRARLSIRAVMRLVGAVLAARHRVTGMVQVDERPDVLWDNPQLDRLYARLENEYELKERAEVLDRKFSALGDFADTLVEIVRDKRAVRLEAAVIVLIAFEIVLNLLGAMH